MDDTPASSIIVTAILAGGRGRRFGNRVKANLIVAGRPLLARLLARLEGQTAQSLLCVAKRHKSAVWVRAADLPVAIDPVEDQGPLAGIAAALTWTRASIPEAQAVVTIPVDTPFVPRDLVARLSDAMPTGGIAIAESGGQRHHAIACWSVSLSEALDTTINNGAAGAIHRWQAAHPLASVSWPVAPFDPFFNINVPDDLRTAAAIAAMIDQT